MREIYSKLTRTDVNNFTIAKERYEPFCNTSEDNRLHQRWISFIWNLAVQLPTFYHYQGKNSSYVNAYILIPNFRLRSQQKPRNEVGSQRPAEHPAEFGLGTFQF